MFRRIAIALLFVTAAAEAASYPPRYRWRTITTEHFFVHAHQGEEELAQRAAAIAEDVHVRLTTRLGWTPRTRTHLILTDHVDVSNGSATPFPTNRIEVYVSAPGADPSSPLEYYDNWLELVITHEYAHILHLDQARAVPGFLRKVLGRHPLTFPNDFSPLWLIEGLATLIESEETDAGRLKGTFVDMVLRTAAHENAWPTAAQASGHTARWPGGNARYFYGSKFLGWVARKYGHDALARYLREYSSNLIPFLVNATAEEVFGAEMSALYAQWSAEQQAEYRAEVARIAAGGLTPRRALTRLGYETKYPLLSPDGTRLAYAHRGPFEDATLRVMDLASGAEVATLRVNSISPLSWSPDGTSIAFAQLEFHQSFSLLSDLYVWRVGGDVRRVTRGARLKDPAFADAKTLIAVQNSAGVNRLVEVDVDSGSVRALVTPEEETQFSEPSVDGTRIAVAEWRAGRIDVVLYSREGTRIANLTEGLPRATNASPRFVGESVWFTSDVTGVPNVFVAARGELRRVTNVVGGVFFPSTRDGRTVFVSDYHASGFDIATIDIGEFSLAGRRPADQPPGRRRDIAAAVPFAAAVPYSPLTSVWPKWWSPVGVGDAVGVTTAGGDVLGFHNYTAQVVVGGESGVQYGVAYSYDRWYPTFTVAGFDDEDETRFLVEAAVPWRRYRWQSVGWLGGLREELDRTGTLQGLRAGIAFNNTRTFGYSISPENGVQARVDYERLTGDADVQQIKTDVRAFLSPIGRHVIAARVAAGRNTGDFVRQRELRVGGVAEGQLVAAGTRDFPVRGYPIGTLRGQKAMLASLEYRLPIYELDRGPSVWPIFFNRVIADVFADYGTNSDRHIASVGAEAALDLVLGYWAPIRYRVGVAYRLRDPGRGEVEPFVALESSF